MLLAGHHITDIISRIEGSLNDLRSGALVLVGEKSSVDLDALIEWFNQNKIQMAGAIVPGIIVNEQQFDDRIVIKPFPFAFNPVIATGLSDGMITIPSFPTNSHASYMVMIDGNSSHISNFLLNLYDTVPGLDALIGFGTSNQLAENHPGSIFTNEGFHTNVAVILGHPLKCSIGVKHGLHKLDGPFIATKTRNNKIEQLNWQPALDVYKSVLESTLAEDITRDNYLHHFRHHPLGITKEDNECIVRDTVDYDDDKCLVCMAEIMENTVFYIMKGNKADFINAAREASIEALSTTQDRTIKDIFVIDCICRYDVLGHEYPEELKKIKEAYGSKFNGDIYGVLSTGEISSAGRGILELYNQTIVIANYFEV